jgi:hypothetical protein
MIASGTGAGMGASDVSSGDDAVINSKTFIAPGFLTLAGLQEGELPSQRIIHPESVGFEHEN